MSHTQLKQTGNGWRKVEWDSEFLTGWILGPGIITVGLKIQGRNHPSLSGMSSGCRYGLITMADMPNERSVVIG